MAYSHVDFENVCAKPEQIDDVDSCDFYHTMDLPGHGHIEGAWDLREGLGAYLGQVPLKGKRVLELGTADGFISFHMEREGADVISYDLSEDSCWDIVPYARAKRSIERHSDDGNWLATLDGFKNGIRRLNNAYWYCHQAFESKAHAVHGDVYSVPAEIGEVDIATFGAILLHTRDPFAALASPLRLTRETVIVTEPRSRLSPPPAVSRLANVLPSQLRRPGMRFLPQWRTGQDPDGWWQLSPQLIAAFLGVLGFEETETTYHAQLYKGRPRRMFTVVGHRTVSA